jgi:hypothetical protein
MATDNSLPNPSTPVISSTSYDLKDKFMTVAAKYFNISDMNVLNAGMFGYINEVMALIGRDGVYHRDTLYDEYFLNTASMPQSIYNKAKEYNYDVAGANPPQMQVSFIIKKSDIIKFATDIGAGQKQFIIDKSNPFTVGNFPFTLEYSVNILAVPTPDGSDYSLSAQYVMDGITQDPLQSTIPTPYIKSYIDPINNENYLYLQLTIWQMSQQSSTFTIFSNDISDNLIYSMNYNDQLVYFDVYYTYNGVTTKIPAYFDDSTTPNDPAYCYYTYSDDSTLQIFFSALPGAFQPEFNSSIQVDVYTTKGTSANFSYSGNVQFSFTDAQYKSVTVAGVVPLSDSAGGTDRPSLMDLKKTLMQMSLMRDNLITETDLQNFFDQIMKTITINNSSLQFIKKRDDILKRTFAAYMLLRNADGYVIPTNTVNLMTTMDNLESNNLTISAGSIAIYDTILKQYRFLRSDEYPEDYVDNDGVIMYSLPFLMSVSIDPFPKVTYYQTTISKDFALNFDYINPNINYEFIIPKLTINRNSFLETSYNISFNLTTNLDKESVVSNVMPRAILRNSSGSAYGYFDFVLNDVQDFGYYAILQTDGTFSQDGLMAVTYSIKDLATGEIIPKVYVDQNSQIEIALMYNGSADTTKQMDFNTMVDVADYATTNVYVTESTIDLFRSMTNLMSSDLIIDSVGNTQIKNVPVIATKYFNNSTNYKDIYSILDNYSTVISANIDRLQNNTDVDLKFYNTYGVCQYSSIDTTNLKLGLNIRLNVPFTQVLDNAIKQKIIGMVEESNVTANSGTGGLLALSNITTALQNSFKEIVFVEFRHLNGVNQQKVQYLYPNFQGLSQEQLINYVPEYLNIGMGSTDYTTFNPDIDIQYI